jgi:glycosyltransferase involved in cell wall biosynthesis
MAKVTVIIPNYNHARFLEKRINSVLNQTYQDFEIIYLDDVSTDNSNQVFAKFAEDKRIRAIYNEVNSGSPFKQWNKGIGEAKGEYVWIAESDDYADERLLEKLVAKLDNHPTVGIAYCQSWEIDENDKILSSMQRWTADLDEQRWQKDFINNGKDECSRYLVFKNTIPNASAVLIRRSVYERVGGADGTMKLAGDWRLWVNILLTSDIAFVSEPLNYFRTLVGGVRSTTSGKNGLRIEESCEIIRYIVETAGVSKDILEEVCEQTVNWWVEWILYYHHYNVLPNSTNYRVYQTLSEIDSRINNRFSKNVVKVFGRKLRPRTRLVELLGRS